MPQKLSDTPETDAPIVSAPKIPSKFAAAYLTALGGSALPGEDDDLDEIALAEAAQFVARASIERSPGTPSLLLEPVAADGTDRRMRLAIINDDMPFLVDSTSQAVAAQGLVVHRILHPVVAAKRDAKGHLQEAGAAQAGSAGRESVIYMELERGDARARRRLLDGLEEALGDVRAAVADWKAMRAAMLADAAMRADDESAELLRWFEGGAMTQLGHEWRARDGKTQDALGISASNASQLLSPAALDAAFAWFDARTNMGSGPAPLLIKSNRLSAVHRRVPLDLVIVPNSRATRSPRCRSMPACGPARRSRRAPTKCRAARAAVGADGEVRLRPGGHAGKALGHALTALPHDLLIAFDADSLETAGADRDVARRPAAARSWCWSERARPPFVRLRLAAARRGLDTRAASRSRRCSPGGARRGGDRLAIGLEDGDARAAPLHARSCAPAAATPTPKRSTPSSNRWCAAGQPAVEADAGEASATRAAPRRWRCAMPRLFPHNYRTRYSPEEAAAATSCGCAISTPDSPRGVRLFAQEPRRPTTSLRLKIYHARAARRRCPTRCRCSRISASGARGNADRAELWPHRRGGRRGCVSTTSRCALPASVDEIALIPDADVIEGAIAAVLDGRAENDAFNELVLVARPRPAGDRLVPRLVPLSAPDRACPTASPPSSTRCAARPR